MKKILAFGMLAICCIAQSQQSASAWTNQRFGFNLDWQRQSGGNSVCGIWRNGQLPGPEAYGYAPSYHHSAAPVATAPSHAHHAAVDFMDMRSFAIPTPQYSPFQFATNPHSTFEFYTPVFGQ